MWNILFAYFGCEVLKERLHCTASFSSLKFSFKPEPVKMEVLSLSNKIPAYKKKYYHVSISNCMSSILIASFFLFVLKLFILFFLGIWKIFVN